MAEHYGTAVIPARVRKPKDKPNAEGAVGVISTWILAALRNQKFFSLSELNEAIKDKLEIFNSNPFQKKAGSRLSVFLEEEKPALQPLPVSPYELAFWKIAIVQFNYHITVEKMHYSVPYEYIKHQVDVRITRQVIRGLFSKSPHLLPSQTTWTRRPVQHCYQNICRMIISNMCNGMASVLSPGPKM